MAGHALRYQPTGRPELRPLRLARAAAPGRVLVDLARTRDAQKRGGDVVQVASDEKRDAHTGHRQDFVAFDDALTALAKLDSRKAKVVELRYFGGLTLEETAEAMGMSSDTVMRDWKMARLWLLKELEQASRP